MEIKKMFDVFNKNQINGEEIKSEINVLKERIINNEQKIDNSHYEETINELRDKVNLLEDKFNDFMNKQEEALKKINDDITFFKNLKINYDSLINRLFEKVGN